MSQQTSGLRFDIYERVHLPEDGAGMKELTSIELNPEIFVDRQGDQAVLRGHLILSGSYSSMDETRGEEQLSHQIPVEITLPLNRIQDVDNITVEIENFDVDVLSARSLNVTGVLSLNGIEMVNAAATEWREEEVVFTHKAEDTAQTEAQAYAAPVFEATPDADEAEGRTEVIAQEEAATEVEAEPVQAELTEEAAEEDAPETVTASAVEENKEIKIAFASKSSEADDTAFGGLNQLLTNTPEPSVRSEAAANASPPQVAEPAPEAQLSHSAPAQQATAQVSAANPNPNPNPNPAPAAAAETEGKDRLQWKKLFLSASADEPQFRKVRMCIARKEDTIETIADRYNKNPRELMLHNRLNDQYLHEGQVLYIP